MGGNKLQEIWGILTGKPEQGKPIKSPQASYDRGYSNSWAVSFNGEKNLGEAGPIKEYSLDYAALRMRSWQAQLESDIAHTIVKKYCKWIIGSGLKLQAEPNKVVLESEGIVIDSEKFNRIAEARFSIFAKSKSSDYAGMENLHILAYTAKKHAIVGGDVLVVQRYIDNCVKVQLIDGAHVCSPIGTEYLLGGKDADGNTTKNGIVQNERGEHVAYWVRNGFLSYEKIEAKSQSTGLQKAFLVYGLKHRIDSNRGMPLLSVVLETLKKLERYKEAVVGSAEERQKIPYTIEHQLGSTGENPLARQLAKAFDADATEDLPKDDLGNDLANTVAATTNKQVFNMPINSALKALESKNELYFKDFFTVNADVVCATVDIPPNVAFSKYDSNYSASRAAIKEWEHTINVDRSDFSFQFYQNIYNFWLEVEIYKNKVQAPGYLLAKVQGNDMVLNAYRNARFVGANVPHIDPVKEVMAIRAKLGLAGADIPLTTVEAGTEELNGGDSGQNLLQFALELEQAKKLKVVQEQKEVKVKKK